MADDNNQQQQPQSGEQGQPQQSGEKVTIVGTIQHEGGAQGAQPGGAEGSQPGGQPADAQGQGPGGKEDDKPQKRKRKVSPVVIVLGVLVLLIIAGLFYWHSTYYEDTDDAEIAGHLDQISARVAGHVINVAVQEEQFVQKGQLLVEIDPADYSASLDQAKANAAAADAAAKAQQVNVPLQGVQLGSQLSSQQAAVQSAQSQITQAQKQMDAVAAQVDSARANAVKTTKDVERYTPLVEKDVISRQQYDQAIAAAQANDAAVNQAQANLLAQHQQVRVARDKLTQAEADLRSAETLPRQIEIQRSRASQADAQYMQAKAQELQADLNLRYTKIYAPYSGIVSKKNVEVGQNITAGQALFTLVSLDDLYVIANFKETQLRQMRKCQPVSVKVDAYGRTLSARVTEVGGATGSELSLFPPENATGNYVKVVQRVPVRIDFTNLAKEDAGHTLRPGLSVEPTVKVKDWGSCQQ